MSDTEEPWASTLNYSRKLSVQIHVMKIGISYISHVNIDDIYVDEYFPAAIYPIFLQ